MKTTWESGLEQGKPFYAMSNAELKTACHERMLRTVGDRATVVARLDRHVARGGGVIPGRVT
jgi:hypothetical protein